MRALLAIVVVLTLSWVVGAEDILIQAPAPYGQRGVSITLQADGTNVVSVVGTEPFRLTGMYVSGTDIDVTLEVGRSFAEEPVIVETVYTNAFGEEETRTQQTGITDSVVTVPIKAATGLTNEHVAITAPFVIKNGDEIRTIVSSETVLILSGERP